MNATAARVIAAGLGGAAASAIVPDATMLASSTPPSRSSPVTTSNDRHANAAQTAAAADPRYTGEMPAPSARARPASSPAAIAAAATASATVAHAGASHSVATIRARRTAALATRVMPTAPKPLGEGGPASWPHDSLGFGVRLGRSDRAVAAIALLIGGDGVQQVLHPEVRPQGVGDPDLRVGDLPEQEVAHAHLAARSDQQVRIGLAGGVQIRGELPLVELVRADAVTNRAPRGVDDLGAAAVAQRDVELHAGVRPRALLGSVELAADVGLQPIGLADDVKSNVVLEQCLELGAEVVLEQPHERRDLGVGPLPVLDGKRVQRQYARTQTRGGLDGVPHGVDAGPVPFDAGQMTVRGPPAVAVHDDRDVARHPPEVDAAHERLFFGPWSHDSEHVRQ